MFYFVLKTRESDNPYKTLFIRELELPQDQLDRMRSKEDEDSVMGEIAEPNFGDEEDDPF